MSMLNGDAAAEEHEEAPNEFLLGRRAALIGLAGGTLTSVGGLLSPALAQTPRTFTSLNGSENRAPKGARTSPTNSSLLW